jgi:uncharacterized membrane protein YecN with MAPEG domain
MSVALTCIALLGFLLFGLGFAVSLKRGGTNALIGHAPDPTDPLHKLVRAHGNTAEFAPLLAVLMLALALNEPAPWTLWCMGIATAARYLLVVGLLASPTLAKPHPLRFVGAATTYVTGIAMSGALLL